MMKTPHLLIAFLSLAFAPLLVPFTFGQGNLVPPPGPPVPTMKTLDQVEARIIVNAINTPGNATNTFIISAPGSYYLTGNLTGAPGKHGISIQADDVTLDLNGFALISGGGGAFRGVNVPLAQTSFSIRNGSVRGWPGGGVRADAAATLAEKLMVAANVGAIGLAVGNGSMIKDCVATGNGTGIRAPDRTQVSNCISTVNTGTGFDCTSYMTIMDCTSSRNGGIGIVVQDSSSVMRCNAGRNEVHGIVAGNGSSVLECTVGSNGHAGIFVSSGCRVYGNMCAFNNTANDLQVGAIKTTGDANLIDSNSCANNGPFGIQATCNNLVVRNSSRGHTLDNFSVGCGTAIFKTDNSAGNPVPTAPWTNFSY